MLTEETFQKLSDMRLHGFAREFQRQLGDEDFNRLSFEERVGFLVDAEWTERQARSLTRRLQQAKLRYSNACIEDIDYHSIRGLDRSAIKRLATSQWVQKHQAVLLTGPTGSGKTYVGCALCHQACRDGYTAMYRRLPRLLHELQVARADGSYASLLSKFARLDVLMIDDWGAAPLDDLHRRDLFEIIEDRYDARSTVIASQLPFKDWYDSVGDPTLAEAILDRIVHAAHKMTLHGESIRKKKAAKSDDENERTKS